MTYAVVAYTAVFCLTQAVLCGRPGNCTEVFLIEFSRSLRYTIEFFHRVANSVYILDLLRKGN